MFRLFSGKKDTPSAEEKMLSAMKCRQVSFVDTDFDALCSSMSQSPEAVMKLAPVNYYAVKNDYIVAYFYSSPDFEENYVRFERFSHEKRTDKSKIYALDRKLLSKALAKVGMIIPDANG